MKIVNILQYYQNVDYIRGFTVAINVCISYTIGSGSIRSSCTNTTIFPYKRSGRCISRRGGGH